MSFLKSLGAHDQSVGAIPAKRQLPMCDNGLPHVTRNAKFRSAPAAVGVTMCDENLQMCSHFRMSSAPSRKNQTNKEKSQCGWIYIVLLLSTRWSVIFVLLKLQIQKGAFFAHVPTR